MTDRKLRMNLRGRELNSLMQSSYDDELLATSQTTMAATGETGKKWSHFHVTLNNNVDTIIHENTNNRENDGDTPSNKIMSKNYNDEKRNKKDTGGWHDLSRRDETDMTAPPEMLPTPGEAPDPVVPNTETTPPENIPAPAEKSVAPDISSPQSRSPEIPMRATKAPEVPITEVPQEITTTTKAPNNLSPGKPLAEQQQQQHHANKNSSSSSSCNTLSCKGLAIVNDHPLLYIPLFFVFVFLCCLKCKKICGGGRRTRDPRGEYRAVGRMLANNFDTELTDDDLNFYASDEDDDDPNSFSHNNNNNNNNGWSHYNNNKGTIELGSVGIDEANGGLTLEEMNG